MSVRAVRGAVQLLGDSKAEMATEIPALLDEMLGANGLTQESVISILFTATPDLVSDFPATAARSAGWSDVPLMCAVEINVAHALPRVIRILLHVESDLPRAAITHIYRGGAKALRPDLTS